MLSFRRLLKLNRSKSTMNSLNSTFLLNATFVRPQMFYISGFSNIPHVKYYYIFLCLVYALTVLGNSFIMFIIFLVRSLHTPKYMAVFNLAVVDMCGSTALIPKLIDTFLFESRFISYEACLSYMFFVHFFSFIQSLTLVVLAYDRFVAICFPLKYHVIVTNTAMLAMLTVVWILTGGLMTTAIIFITRLSFCKTTMIESYFCDHGPTYRMACNDYTPNNIIAIFCTALYFIAPLVLIALSYLCIIFALIKIASMEGRLKAMKTCTSHLILVAVFYFPISATYLVAFTATIHPNARIINTSLATVIPPLLNPIIYTLKTEEIMVAINKLYKRNKIFSTISNNK
ncbi:olfactory receptor 1E16-like [Lepisosteus oculatus]|uniref:olfactory receptor 1E16-like n=1 Tax=Lepisosteus oculatus TaxID=7918 RepID=UPI003720392D